MGDFLVQRELQQQDHKSQPQCNGGVKKDDLPLVFRVVQLLMGRPFEITAG